MKETCLLHLGLKVLQLGWLLHLGLIFITFRVVITFSLLLHLAVIKRDLGCISNQWELN